MVPSSNIMNKLVTVHYNTADNGLTATREDQSGRKTVTPAVRKLEEKALTMTLLYEHTSITAASI